MLGEGDGVGMGDEPGADGAAEGFEAGTADRGEGLSDPTADPPEGKSGEARGEAQPAMARQMTRRAVSAVVAAIRGGPAVASGPGPISAADFPRAISTGGISSWQTVGLSGLFWRESPGDDQVMVGASHGPSVNGHRTPNPAYPD
jgi:hypothetical protein